jgi:NAD(P)-dependent dehydrogenase (short-subunit alcohol dehydrogenase family)
MGRTVLVTGGTGALGRAVVRRFAEAGGGVHVPWIVENEVAELERALGDAFKSVRLHHKDVTSEEQVAALFRDVEEDSGQVDVLANIVGGFAAASLEDTNAETWYRMVRLNVTSVFFCSRAAVPGMKARRWGRIINVSSAPAINHGSANLSAYSAAKAAVLNLSESLAKELAPWNVTVNALVPSVIDTAANRKANPDADASRWLKPEEIANVIEFLASDAAAVVTGTAVNLSRG